MATVGSSTSSYQFLYHLLESLHIQCLCKNAVFSVQFTQPNTVIFFFDQAWCSSSRRTTTSPRTSSTCCGSPTRSGWRATKTVISSASAPISNRQT